MTAPSQKAYDPRLRTGSTSGANIAKVAIVGVKEFRRELKTYENPKRWAREFGTLNRELAKDAAGWSRFQASTIGGPAGHFVDAIVGRGGVTGARIQIKDEAANAAFWGAKYAPWSGWNARNQGSGPRNLPEWVGNSWDVAVRGQGPYAINEALADHLPEIQRRYQEGQVQIIANASAYWTETF